MKRRSANVYWTFICMNTPLAATLHLILPWVHHWSYSTNGMCEQMYLNYQSHQFVISVQMLAIQNVWREVNKEIIQMNADGFLKVSKYPSPSFTLKGLWHNKPMIKGGDSSYDMVLITRACHQWSTVLALCGITLKDFIFLFVLSDETAWKIN